MQKEKIIKALTVFCFGAIVLTNVDTAAGELPDVILWEYNVDNSVLGGIIEATAFLDAKEKDSKSVKEANIAAGTDSVLVGARSEVNGQVKTHIINIDAKTGEERWVIDFPYHDKVLKISSVPDQTNDGKEDAVITLRFKLSPQFGHTILMDGETGEWILITPFTSDSVENHPSIINPVVGDFNGDGEKDNLLYHSFQKVLIARE